MSTKNFSRFLDDEGRVKLFPAKQSARTEVYAYLASKFEPGRDYTEHEVNALLASWHTFGDLFILRRGLIESGRVKRVPDGSRYWLNPDFTEPEPEA